MNQSHVIDSWIAELGLSGRKSRRVEQPAPPPATAMRAGREALAAAADYALNPRYQVISSPC